MCGRYSFNTTHAQRLRHLTELLAQRGVKVQTGEVAPGDQMAVVTRKNTHMVVTAVRWGFPGYNGGRPLINARAESVLSKPTFRDAFLNQRCVFPSDAFYEWDASHTRFSFAQPDGGLIFLAGFIRQYPDGPRGIILTTAPNSDVRAVHDRMPLMVPEARLRDWIMDEAYAQKLLQAPMGALTATRQIGLGQDMPLGLEE